MKFNNVCEAIDYIASQRKIKSKSNLDKMKKACLYFDSPEKSFKSIHITGTNGKGSTSLGIYTLLKEKGYKTGLFISPYVLFFNERIRINDSYISDEEVLKYTNILYEYNMINSDDPLSFFELCTMMAFMYFRDMNVQYAVIEVGIGGRLDSTNVSTPILSLITSVSLDHMNILGSTKEEILKEKLGIMKDGVPFLTHYMGKLLDKIVKEEAKVKHSPLRVAKDAQNVVINALGTHFSYKGSNYTTSLIGSFQAKNMSLVIETYNILNEYYHLDISEDILINTLSNLSFPGRFELFDNGNIVIDGSHNPEAALNFRESLSLYSNKECINIFCAMADKDTKSMIDFISSYTSHLIFTQISYHRCAKASDLYSSLSNKSKAEVIENLEEAIKKGIELKNKEDKLLVISGSLYLISEAREILRRIYARD